MKFMCKGFVYVLSIVIFISISMISAEAEDNAFIVEVKDNLISIHAEDVGFQDVLKSLGDKAGFKVTIFEGVPDKKVSINLENVPVYSLSNVLEEMSLKNAAVVYDEESSAMAIYVLPVGKDVAEALKGKTIIRQAHFAAGENIQTIKGKEIVSATKGKNDIPIRYVKDELLLKFNLGVTEQEIEEILKKHNLVRIPNTTLDKIGYIKTQIPDERDVTSVIKELRKEYKLKTPEPNYVLNVLTVSDPLYDQQWYIPDTKFPEAWEIVKTKGSVTVAVIDTGVDTAHPDLDGKILPGYDFVNNDAEAIDDNGHGTFVSGIIAAQANEIGIKGLYDQALILPVKTIAANGLGTYEDVASGIIFATDNNAKVINLSIGGYGFSYMLQDAVDYALEKGCILVAAGGNDGIEQEIYPAAYPDVIGVSALGYNGEIWSGSNSGKHIDVSAPGMDILSTGMNGNYVYASGTSASAPMVSSLAATLCPEKPDLSSSYIRRLVIQSSEDLGEKGFDSIFGGGEIDAYAALKEKVKPFHDVAVASIIVEPVIFEENKPIFISVNLKNYGSFNQEKAVLKVSVNDALIYKLQEVLIQDRLTVVVPWILVSSDDKNLFFKAVVQGKDDVDESNNTKMKALEYKNDEDGLYSLHKINLGVHQWIAGEALREWPKSSDNPTALSEMSEHVGPSDAISYEYDMDIYYSNFSEGYSIIKGARDEDTGANPFGNSELDPLDEMSSLRHFWDRGSEMAWYEGGFSNDYFKDGATYDSAVNRAYKYWTGGNDLNGNYDETWDNNGGERDHGVLYWYQHGNKQLAYEYLGHIVHLLTDMSVPAHVHNDQHGLGDDNFEDFLEEYNQSVYPNNFVFKRYGDDGYNEVDGTIPDYTVYKGTGTNSGLYHIFLETAEKADNYESDDGDGGGNEETPNERNGHADDVVGDVSYEECANHQSALEPYVIKQVAALYKWFWAQTHDLLSATNPSPSDDAVGVSIDIDLSWSDAAGATSYDVYFGTDSTPDSGEFKGNQASNIYDPGPLNPAAIYYWRIDSRDGATTTTGTVWSFMTQSIGSPAAPINPFPANGVTQVSLNTDISWTDGGGAIGYDVYFGTNPSPGILEYRGTELETTYDPGTLISGTTYYWRIDAINSNGVTTGTVWSFTTEGSAPLSAPIYLSPANGSTYVSTNPTLTWMNGGGATEYKVFLASHPTDLHSEGHQTSTSFTATDLDPCKTYYWRIEAWDENDNIVSGPVWSFTTMGSPPTDPSPVNGATDVPVNLTLSWSDVGEGYEYDVYLGQETIPEDLKSNNQSSAFYTPGNPREYDTTYYWRIDTIGPCGTIPGNIWHFRTQIAPPEPATNPSPVNDLSMVPLSAKLSWSNGGRATSYNVYFGASPDLGESDFKGNQTPTTFDPGILDCSVTYYWRIDSVNSTATTTGPVWTFRSVDDGTCVEGLVINDNVTWQASGSPYYVRGNFVVASGASLTIDPCVEVVVVPGIIFDIRGHLEAVGTAESGIVFRASDSGVRGSWQGISTDTIYGASANLQYITVRDAQTALSVGCGSLVTISDSTFSNNVTALAVHCCGGDMTVVERCLFEDNTYAFTGSDKNIYDSVFTNNEYGLYQTVGVNVYSCTFTGNQVALYGGYGEVQYCTISGNGTGVQGFHGGFSLSYNTIINNETGVILGQSSSVEYNNIYDNATYDLMNSDSDNKYIPNNWWGTTDPCLIEDKIYDGCDDSSADPCGLVQYSQVLSEPYETSPSPVDVARCTECGSDVVWEASGSPYQVTGTMTIFPGYTLTIEPGAEVVFAAGASLNIRGHLEAVGTAESGIVFRASDSGVRGSWQGINIDGGSANLQYITVQDAQTALSSVGCGSLVTISDSTFSNNVTALAVHCCGGDMTVVERCLFENNTYAVTGSDKNIYDSVFTNNEYGLYQTVGVNVYSCTFTGNQVALYGGYGEVQYCTISGNGTGVQGFHGGFSLSYNTIINNETGVILGQSSSVEYNNIYDNATYDLMNSDSDNKYISNNWWGTTDLNYIQTKIYDIYDDVTLGEVLIEPILSDEVNIYEFVDTDNDGIPDSIEDANGNRIVDPGETDPRNIDTDGDGIQDGTEIGYNIDSIGPGTDADIFQPDLDPTTTTDPLNSDTDGDGFLDGEEDANHNGRVDAWETDPVVMDIDSDSDGMIDSWEIMYFEDLSHDGTADGDGDGLDDLTEFHYRTNPTLKDTDSDGLDDLAEFYYNTDPIDPDTDGDGIPDGWEVSHGLNPMDDDSGGDLDLDGFTNVQEYLAGTDPADDHSIPVQNLSMIFGPQRLIYQVTDDLFNSSTADLDGDGDQDVISCSLNGGTIVWFENQGDKTFGEQQIIASFLMEGWNSISIADMDGDQDMDILCASNANNMIVWYENNGDGTIWNENIISGDTQAVFVQAADLDGDGDQDILFSYANGEYSYIAWYANNGDGTFGLLQDISSVIGGILYVAIGDIDGDNDLDIFSSYLVDGELSWYENNGDGTFASRQMILPANDTDKFLYLSDLDCDGDIDILGFSFGEKDLCWYENEGDGNFESCHLITVEANLFSLVINDLDGDGDPDLLVSDSSQGNISWYENDGNALFGQRQIISDIIEMAFCLSGVDLDNDGDKDILASTMNDGKIVWFENEGASPFGQQQFIFTDADGVISLKSGDMDSDGDIDILFIKGKIGGNQLVWYENNGSNEFVAEHLVSSDYSGMVSLFPVDLDGDSDLDILTGSYSDGEIVWYENTGDGTFLQEQVIAGGIDDYAVYLNIIDFDMDNDPDVMISVSSSGEIVWFENMSDGTFSSGPSISIDTENTECLVNAVDLDQDGDMDILTGMSAREKIVWYENNGDLTFTEERVISEYAVENVINLAYDADQDGDMDVLSYSGNYGPIYLYRNNGSGIFDEGIILVDIDITEDRFLSVTPADIDGDGYIDLLCTFNYYNLGYTEMFWFKNNGDGSLGDRHIILSGAYWIFSTLAADLDDDNDLEIFYSFSDKGRIVWHENLMSVALDSDEDGLIDDIEIAIGTDPYDADTDDDGLVDGNAGSEDLDADGIVDPGETDPLNPDTDGDGIFDGTERGLTEPETADTDLSAGHFVADADPSTTSDPADADSDNDGIIDGNEDKNHDGLVDMVAGETDPNNPDTDGDGILDCIEIGLTEPENPADTDLAAGNFVPDSDPSTTTNPSVADSDGDGIADGIEDANFNGMVDLWEPDPGSPSSPSMTVIMTLKKGFNLVTIPVDVSSMPDLRDWMPVLGNSTQIDRVMCYDEQIGGFVTLIPGDSNNQSILLQPGDGLEVYAKHDRSISFNNPSCSPIDLNTGFNLVGLNCPSEGYSAYNLLNAIGPDNIISIQCFDADTGTFESAGFNADNQPSGIDFLIVPGEGYFIYMKQGVVDFNY